jgi:hypothetical protein
MDGSEQQARRERELADESTELSLIPRPMRRACAALQDHRSIEIEK